MFIHNTVYPLNHAQRRGRDNKMPICYGRRSMMIDHWWDKLQVGLARNDKDHPEHTPYRKLLLTSQLSSARAHHRASRTRRTGIPAESVDQLVRLLRKVASRWFTTSGTLFKFYAQVLKNCHMLAHPMQRARVAQCSKTYALGLCFEFAAVIGYAHMATVGDPG